MARCGCRGAAVEGGYIPIRTTPPNPAVFVAYLDSSQVPPVLMVWNGTAWILAASGGGSGTPMAAFTDNGDGTFTATGAGVADNANGTFTVTATNVTDNGNGTWTGT